MCFSGFSKTVQCFLHCAMIVGSTAPRTDSRHDQNEAASKNITFALALLSFILTRDTPEPFSHPPH